ncbi:MAG: hypothetical protein O3A51_07690 [Verrucomicrobia bacterium]|nr:hypothetical protein [Verrucomicrobiota bacterium]
MPYPIGMKIGTTIIFLAGMLLSGCAATHIHEGSLTLKEGRWTITKPAGETFTGNIMRLEDGTYEFSDMYQLGGIYEVWKDSLIIKKPVHRNFTTLAWRIQGPRTLTLVQAPPVALVGTDYHGTIARQD